MWLDLCRAENRGLKEDPRWVTISILCPEGLGAHESDAKILQGGSCFAFLPDVNEWFLWQQSNRRDRKHRNYCFSLNYRLTYIVLKWFFGFVLNFFPRNVGLLHCFSCSEQPSPVWAWDGSYHGWCLAAQTGGANHLIWNCQNYSCNQMSLTPWRLPDWCIVAKWGVCLLLNID